MPIQTQKRNLLSIDDLISLKENFNEFEAYYKGRHILISPISDRLVIIRWGDTIDEEEGPMWKDMLDCPIMDGKTLRQMAAAGDLTWDC